MIYESHRSDALAPGFDLVVSGRHALLAADVVTATHVNEAPAASTAAFTLQAVAVRRALAATHDHSAPDKHPGRRDNSALVAHLERRLHSDQGSAESKV